MTTAQTIEVGDEVIQVPEDASESVKKAIETLKNRMAKDAEKKLADIWGGDENKSATEKLLTELMRDVFTAQNVKPDKATSAWVEVKFGEDGSLASAELFTKVTRIRASTGERKAKSGGNGASRKSVRDLVLEKYGSEPKSYKIGTEEFSSPSKVLDKLAVPYYKASDTKPTGDAPQRAIVKFGRDNPDAAADIEIVLEDGSAHTLAELTAKAEAEPVEAK